MIQNNELRIRILLTLQHALLGEVSSTLRGLACTWSSKKINLYAVFDGAINDDDQDSMECVETELISSCPDQIVNLECVQIDYPRPIDLYTAVTWIYLRKEGKDTNK